MNSKNILTYLLIPFSWLYGIAVAIRNLMFDTQILKQKEFNIPVISVGNITAGGTGKTPHVEYLVNLLKKEFKVATLSRGYKRKTKGFISAGNNPSADEIGDEPSQIKGKFPDVEVAVDNDRAKGIQKLLASEKQIEVIILDDAYQHRYVKPGLSLLLIDYSRPLTEDFLLPFGRLREPVSAKRRADIIIVTKCPETIKPIDRRIVAKNLELMYFQNLYFTTVIPGDIKPVFASGSITRDDLLPPKNPAILLISGIANPHDLKKFALSISTNISELIFPDHHDYSEKDINLVMDHFYRIPEEEKIIITTEKDAVRLRKFENLPEEIREKMFFIPVRISFLNDDEENFNKQILNYVRSNKRNGILHQGKNRTSA